MRPTRQGMFAAGVTVLLAAVLAGVIAGLLSLRSQVDEQTHRAESLTASLTRSQQAVAALSRQVQGLGATPVTAPAVSVSAGPLVLIPGPAGRDGRNGLNGQNGIGVPGRDGRPGRDSLVPGPMSTLTPSPGAQGEKGDKGDPGADATQAPDPCTWQPDQTHPGFEVCTRPSATPSPTP